MKPCFSARVHTMKVQCVASSFLYNGKADDDDNEQEDDDDELVDYPFWHIVLLDPLIDDSLKFLWADPGNFWERCFFWWLVCLGRLWQSYCYCSSFFCYHIIVPEELDSKKEALFNIRNEGECDDLFFTRVKLDDLLLLVDKDIVRQAGDANAHCLGQVAWIIKADVHLELLAFLHLFWDVHSSDFREAIFFNDKSVILPVKECVIIIEPCL